MKQSYEFLLLTFFLCGVVTFLTRAFPFFFMRWIKDSKLIAYVGFYLPPAIMTLLVLYCLRKPDMSIQVTWQEVSCMVLVLGLQLWRRNALVSLFAGTGAFVLLTHYSHYFTI